MNNVLLGKVLFQTGNMEELVKELKDSVEEMGLETVITPNLDMWYRIQKSTKYDDLVGRFTKTIPDGMPIARAISKISGKKQSRIAGSDLLPRLIVELQNSGRRICFVGGPKGVAEKCSEMSKTFGLLGSFVDSPMGLLQSHEKQEDLISRIVQIDFDVLVLGFGFPLQEILTDKISRRRGRGLYLNIGMALLYLSGDRARAPKWMQMLGLEWLFRLTSEPTRLFRRYVLDGPRAYFCLRNLARKIK
jgi:N-acetylglucosaminyldiphosphoundecaprenol N-acetyl-beta-D-mannosaminyltransferase